MGIPIVTLEQVSLIEANELLLLWGHRMGILHRGRQGATCHAMFSYGEPLAVTTVSSLIMPRVGGAPHLTRDNAIELSRLCASRSGLNRVMLRLWREFVFPNLGYQYAISYQDADIHNGNTYRFDGWTRVSRSRSGTDTRTGRKGRDKWVWVWEIPKI